MINIAINGFGRIGRATLKAAWNNKNVKFVALNDLSDTRTLAHLLKYDTLYGTWDHQVSHDKDHIIIDGKKIKVLSEREPGKLPWGKMKIDVVLECTGLFVTAEKTQPHIDAGAKAVVISAPAKGGGVSTYVIGVNNNKLNNKKVIYSNASCTTNCLAPIMKIICDAWGVKKSLMTTIHAYTSTQNLVDGPHKDLRRARAAAQNIILTSTGAALATTQVVPSLKNKFDGIAIRVPVLVGSLIDVTAVLKKKTTTEKAIAHFKKVVKRKEYKGIVAVNEKPLVSSDFVGTTYSSIIDLPFVRVMDGDLIKILAWYDNEWGYSVRLGELAVEIGKKFKK